MNREIKFRGKTTEGKWVYGDLKRVNDNRRGGNRYYIWVDTDDVEDEGRYVLVDRETLGQFILHDTKRNREMYEGDIYFHEEEYDEGDERTFFIATYITERCAFTMLSAGEWLAYTGGGGIDAIKDDFEGFRFEMQSEDITKLHFKGNIHDNPELLKGGQNAC
ncbi:YopX family protein [Olivibacter sp. 47]|uniref:YopX family protein n=1 Tax=Olivibacter sp. 47 TaxID=3056486 RepID=UPI0025A448F5|nr:YopX family protein [Olivibacter sp. 47]MDM8174828.1 YopX family protein [Olivibacter sp. 47]